VRVIAASSAAGWFIEAAGKAQRDNAEKKKMHNLHVTSIFPRLDR
jgi:hypothetical protein